MVVTCPLIDCVYNGFGECQMGLVAGALETGVATGRHCPYYERAGGEERPAALADPGGDPPGQRLLG